MYDGMSQAAPQSSTLGLKALELTSPEGWRRRVSAAKSIDQVVLRVAGVGKHLASLL
jgi:hypothetical protein